MGKWESWWETQDTGERGERSGKERRKKARSVEDKNSETGIYSNFEGPGHRSTGQETGPRKASHQAPPPAALSPPWETEICTLTPALNSGPQS